MSEHLPVFTVYDKNYKNNNKPNKKQQYRRIRSEETMNAFKNDLLAQNWDSVYQNKDADSAYKEFLRIFTSLYNKNCPIKQYSRRLKYTECPWITMGLQNACKKKNALYKDFIRLRTKEAENKYKNILKSYLIS